MNISEKTNIVQSNYLVENRPSLSKDETRLFLTIIGAINKGDEDFKLLQIPVSEFAALWGIETKHAYQQIKDALRGLRNKEFFIEGENPQTGKQRFLSASSISAAVYEEGEGYATVEISQLFRPYLLELKEKYTVYVLQNIMNLSSVNAIRNYEILKQYQTIGKREITLLEYKRMLQIEEKYSRHIDLKRYVIEPSIKEVNEKTDIFVEYNFGGRGDKAYVIFTIQSQSAYRVKHIIPEIPAKTTSSHTDEETSQECFELEFYKEIEQFREALTNPNSLSHEQLDVCVTVSQTSAWYQALPAYLSPEKKNSLLKAYIKQQDKHSLVNYKESFYGYLRRSCQNNWAEVPKWQSNDEKKQLLPPAEEDDYEQLEMFEPEDKLGHERDLREEVCEGFQNTMFDEFTLDQLKEFRALAAKHVDLDEVDRVDSWMHDRRAAYESVIYDYVRSKIMMCNAKGQKVKDRLGFIRGAIAEDWR